MLKPATAEAYDLMHRGTLALANVEANGIKIDVDYLDQALDDVDLEIALIEEKLKKSSVWKLWSRKFGPKAGLGKNQQLASIIFGEMNHPVLFTTNKGAPKTDEAAFEHIDLPFVQRYFKWKKLQKIKGTYFKGIKRETCDEFLYNFFHLHLARTYRSSSSLINFQNIPVRDPVTAKIIRQCFIPRADDRVLVEIDFSGIEVRIAACVIGSTKIETIDGPQSIKKVTKRVNRGEKVYVYGYCRNEQRVKIARVLEGGKTKEDAEVWKVTLDNGESVTATPNHRFLLRSGKYRKLRDLKTGDSLMPLYKTKKKSYHKTVYEKVYLNNGETMLAHNLVALDVHGVQIAGSKLVVHHDNGNGCDNSLSNLKIMTRRQHMKIHSIQGWKNHPAGTGARHWWQKSAGCRNHARKINTLRKETWTEADWEEFGRKVSEGIQRKGGRAGSNNTMYGRTQSAETREKISRSKKGVKLNRPAWNKGHTKDTHPGVLKISERKKGKPSWNKGKKLPPLSTETRNKLSLAITGKVRSEATKKRLSESKRKYWEERRRSGPQVECPVCKKKYNALASHMKRKHGTTPTEYRKTHNHKVTSVEFVGREDVYNITVEGIHNYATHAGVIIKNCYNKDPVLIKYIKDPTKDMHRDMAAEIYCCEPKQVNKMTRYCNPPEAPMWMADGSFKPLGDIVIGDRLMGWERDYKKKGKRGNRQARKRLRPSIVTAVHKKKDKIYRVTMSSGRVLRCTKDHLWINGKSQFRGEGDTYTRPEVGRTLAHVVQPCRKLTRSETRTAGWLGGIYDGEGSNRNISQSPTHNPEVCSKIEESLQELGFDYYVHRGGRKGGDKCVNFYVAGGLQGDVDFLNHCKPARKKNWLRSITNRSSFFKKDEIVKIEEDGYGEVLGLTTTTGNYVCWGYASKNCAKNMFVFPEFYGSYFVQCAPNLWSAMSKHKLDVDGIPMQEWLKDHGIKKLGEKESNYNTGRIKTKKGTFYDHIRNVEEDFWGNRFKVYSAWKKRWYEKYLSNGGFHTLTGFTHEGYLKRNDVINYPVQGSAFHCLLWTLTELNSYLVKNRMKSLIVGQIHDSIVGDVHLDELDDYIATARWLMTEALLDHWKWINVPIDVEIDVTPPGGSWYEKKPLEVAA